MKQVKKHLELIDKHRALQDEVKELNKVIKHQATLIHFLLADYKQLAKKLNKKDCK